MKITFFAHSTTTDNAEHRATGWLQGKLSEKGIQQAAILPTLIEDISFTVVYSSDLKRAIESAQIGFGDTHPIRHDKRLREANYGDFDGTDKSFKKDMRQFISFPYPNGESYADVEVRMQSFLDDVYSEFSEDHIAIIGHEATQLALDVIINSKSWEQAIEENWRPTQKWQPGWIYNYQAYRL
jgi:2,3-bisphosphoglycerate-dependent phosphoglycerate mutase